MMIELKPTLATDLDLILAIQNAPDSIGYILPSSKEEHETIIQNPNQDHLSIFSTIDNGKEMELLGFILLGGKTSPHHSMEFQRIVIASKGKGYGRQAIQLVKKYCFEQLKCHRLWLDVFEENERARHLYQSEGFEEEGIIRDCIYDGTHYRSLVLMSIINKE